MQFKINCHDNEYISNLIKKHGFYEGYTTEILMELSKSPHLTKQNTTFIDIGANIGWFSLSMASFGFRVLAFEPVFANHDLLQKSIYVNGFYNINLHKVAIGDECKNITLNICPKNMGMCSTRKLYMKYVSSTETVPCVTLDGFFKSSSESAVVKYIVKIDVEWMELHVLRGMKQLLQSSVCYLIIELSVYSPEIFEILRQAGFDVAVFIGFDGKDELGKTKLSYETAYLKDKKYYHSLDKCEEIIVNRKNDQDMLLITRQCDVLY